MTDARFFIDHGLWHDRETGQHLYTEDQHVAALTELENEVWNELATAGNPRDGIRTLGESIRKLTDTVPDGVLRAISNAGLTLTKTDRGYEIRKFGSCDTAGPK